MWQGAPRHLPVRVGVPQASAQGLCKLEDAGSVLPPKTKDFSSGCHLGVQTDLPGILKPDINWQSYLDWSLCKGAIDSPEEIL